MKIKRLMSLGSAVLVSLSSLLVINLGHAFAATKTWTGTAGDHKFSTGGNWTGGVAPSSGDALVFNGTGVTDIVPNNDMVGASFASIAFQGLDTSFTISGNSFTLTGGITDTTTCDMQCSLNVIASPVVISGSQSIASSGNGILISGAVSGSGNITKTGTGYLYLE